DPVMTAALDCEASDAPTHLAALASGKRALAIGPGMPTGAGAADRVRAALALEVPIVLDADALNHLAGQVDLLPGALAPVVLTPPPGEAARLLGRSAGEVGAARVRAG